MGNFDPNKGPSKGGTQVKISGSGLSGANGLTFGTTPATSFTVVSDSEIDAVTPAHDPGWVDVTATFPNGDSDTLHNAYYYAHPLPEVLAIQPSSGPTAGGTSVKICTRYGDAPVTGVLFGSTPASSFTMGYFGEYEIDAVSPPGTAGTVDIRLTNSEGRSPVTSADQYTYTS